MNAAVFSSALSFFGCTIAAGASAVVQHAGCFTPGFVLLGAALGFVSAVGVQKMAYALLSGGGDSSTFAGVSRLIAYMLLPLLAGAVAIAAVGQLVVWATRHVQ